MIVNEKLIKDLLLKHSYNNAKYLIYDRYYKGQHDILTNYNKLEARSNKVIVYNFAKKFIEEEISYVLGRQECYNSKSGNNELVKDIDYNTSFWSRLHNQELLRQALIFNEAYELNYLNVDGEFRSIVLNPLNCYVLTDGSYEENVLIALYKYKRTFNDEKNEVIVDDNYEYLDVYTQDYIIKYEKYGDTLKEINRIEHYFGRVPINILKINSDGKTLIDDIKSQNDAYNEHLSNLWNESNDFRNALLKLVGTKIHETDIDEINKSGVVQVPTNGQVEWLIKQLDYEDSFVMLNGLKEDIYEIAHHVNTNEKLQSNLSGAALRSRLIALEFKCTLLETCVDKLIKERLKNLFAYLKVISNKLYDYRDIDIKFTINIPQDFTNVADAISKLKDLKISEATKLSMLWNVTNPAVEIDNWYKEKEREMQFTKKFESDMVDLDTNMDIEDNMDMMKSNKMKMQNE